MSDMEFWELLYTTKSVLPDQEAISKMFERARMMDANAIFSKLIEVGGISDHIDIVRSVTEELTEDEMTDIILDFIIDIYPGVTKEIERDEKDSKLLLDVIGLCVQEVKNV